MLPPASSNASSGSWPDPFNEGTPPPVSQVPLEDSHLVQHISPVFMLSTPEPMEDFFSLCKRMAPKEFELIMKEGQLINCGKDTIIYLQGEESDSFYVINDGLVEVVISDMEGQNPVPVTHLRKGDLFGEVGLLTGVPRTASIRVPISATLIRYDKAAFEKLVSTAPVFGHYLSMLLARRLHKTTVQLHFYSQMRELSGSLNFFDLPTIFQTIFFSQQHGVMHVFNLTADVMGEFGFVHGKPISARYLHLHGLEALYQLFQVTPQANFGFTRLHEPPVVSEPLDIPNVNEFTMNAIHMKDEMQVLEEKLNLGDGKPIKRIHARMGWDGVELQPCATALWQELTREPQSLDQLLLRLPFCRYHVLKVLDQLFETQQVALAEITPYGYR
jgi:CRP-like cAMP-binding protein